MLTPGSAIGVVCNRVPAQVYQWGPTSFCMVSTGSCVVIYKTDTLKIVFASRAYGGVITAFAPGLEDDRSYVATDDGVVTCRDKHVDIWTHKGPTAVVAIHSMRVSSVTYDVIVAYASGRLEVLRSDTGEVLKVVDTTPELGVLGGSAFNSRALLPTPRRVVVGGSDGCLVAAYDIESARVDRRYQSVKHTLLALIQDINKTAVDPTALEEWRVDVLETAGQNVPAFFVALSAHGHTVHPAVVMLVDSENDTCLSKVVLTAGYGRVNGLAFHHDVNQTALMIATASGDVLTFDIEKNRLANSIRMAHVADFEGANTVLTGVTAVHVLSDTVILTSGSDNSLRMWQRDSATSQVTVLRQREGLMGEINHLAFYDAGDDARQLLAATNINRGSAGVGRVAEVNFRQIQQTQVYPVAKNLAVINAAHKQSLADLPRVVDMAFCPERHFDWPNVMTCHEGRHEVYLWSVDRRTLAPLLIQNTLKDIGTMDSATISSMLSYVGKVKKQIQYRRPPATSVAISQCGHFGVVGYVDGSMEHFNLQSRRSVAVPKMEDDAADFENLEDMAVSIIQDSNALRAAKKRRVLESTVEAHVSKTRRKPRAIVHDGPVRHLHVAQSSAVISASDKPGDCRIRFWNLRTGLHDHTVDLAALAQLTGKETYISSTKLDGVSLTVCCNGVGDGEVLVLNVLTGQIMRRFGPIPGRALEAQLSPSGAWLAVSSVKEESECHLMVFDIVSNARIEWMQFEHRISAFTFHPSNAYLFTAHANAPVAGSSVAEQLTVSGSVYSWANVSIFSDAEPLTLVSKPRLMSLPPVASPIVEETEMSETLDDWTERLPALLTESADLFKSDSRWGPIALNRLLNWSSLEKKSATPVAPVERPELPFFLGLPTVVQLPEDEPAPLAAPRPASKLFDSKAVKASAQTLETLLGSTIPRIHRELLSAATDPKTTKCFLRLVNSWMKEGRALDFVQVLVALFIRMHGLQLCEDGKPCGKQWREFQQLTEKRWATTGNLMNMIICYTKLAALLQFE